MYKTKIIKEKTIGHRLYPMFGKVSIIKQVVREQFLSCRPRWIVRTRIKGQCHGFVEFQTKKAALECFKKPLDHDGRWHWKPGDAKPM